MGTIWANWVCAQSVRLRTARRTGQIRTPIRLLPRRYAKFLKLDPTETNAISIAAFASDVKRWGLTKTLYAATMSRLEKHLNLHLALINTRSLDADQERPPVLPGDRVRVCEAWELRPYASSELDLSIGFLEQRSGSKDVCVCYFSGSDLVAYVWLGFDRIPMEMGLSIAVQKPYVYSYKAFTHAEHRGRHLQHRLGKENDNWLIERGYRFNVDYIKSHNFASLIADRRYGNKTIGFLAYSGFAGRCYSFESKGLRSSGFRILKP